MSCGRVVLCVVVRRVVVVVAVVVVVVAAVVVVCGFCGGGVGRKSTFWIDILNFPGWEPLSSSGSLVGMNSMAGGVVWKEGGVTRYLGVSRTGTNWDDPELSPREVNLTPLSSFSSSDLDRNNC